MDRFTAAYALRLEPARPHEPWPAGDAWASRLGDATAWPAYRDLFAQWLEHENAGEVLEVVLPRFMEGCGGAAFHGLIRTAYAVTAARRHELADALAHWAARWQPLAAAAGEGDVPSAHATDGPPTDDPAAVLPTLPVPSGAHGSLIAEHMAAAAAQPGFARAAARLVVGEDTLDRLARGAAILYAGSGNFTVLHLLTSAHAVRVLMRWLGDPAPACRAYWQAWAAGWAASGARPRGDPPPDLAWPVIVARAIASDDEHVIKVVDSCREQERALGGPEWRAAAARAVGTERDA
ncbi:MAG: questin oxidase family protein [Ideonella sp.]|nr:questin oxidase family protein [Ideonella sp.]